MLASDADRLDSLRALGAVCFATEAGPLLGLFTRESVPIDIDDAVLNDSSPQITCRTIDVQRLQLQRGARLTGTPGSFALRVHQPDGTGLSVLILDAA